MSDTTMRRHDALVSAVLTGTRDTEALAKKLGVSIITIRRDLNTLANQGRIVRTFGGAAPMGGHEPELNPVQRKFVRKEHKDAIARTAAGTVLEGETIFLDGGTTTAAIAHALRGRRGIKVITNSLMVWVELSQETGLELIILGGSVRSLSWATSGVLGEMALRRLTADRAFIGADGLVANRGICEASLEQIQFKEIMMAQSDQVYVVVDSTKLGRAAQQVWAPIDRPWTLITDAEASKSQLEPFQAIATIKVIVASEKTRGTKNE